MKSLIYIVLSLWAFSGFASTIEITEALKQGKIKVTTAYQTLGEKGISLTVKNNGAQPLDILIPSGTTFSPDGNEEQVLMNIQEEHLSLASGQIKKIEVGGYCTQRSKLAPRLENNFKVGKTNNTLLLSFLDFLKTNKPSPSNYQSAVWALTDNESIASIEPYTPTDQKLREHISKLTKRENPWYSSGQQLNVVPGRPIQRNTVNIKGNLEVKLSENTQFEVVVVNSDNKEMMRMPKDQFIEKNIDHSFRFSISVQGWEVGTYHVLLRKKSDQSKIASFAFEV
jgi:hypothetical protein